MVLLQSPLQDGTSQESKESYRESYTIYENTKMVITYPKMTRLTSFTQMLDIDEPKYTCKFDENLTM